MARRAKSQKRKPEKPTPKPADSRGRTDATLWLRAEAKLLLGKEHPTREEVVAHRRHEEERLRAAMSRIRKKLYTELSGRDHRVLIDVAHRYGLPLLGPTVDLFEAVRALHDFVAEHGRRDPDDKKESVWKEEKEKESALSMRTKRKAGEGVLCSREAVHQCFTNIATRLRQAAEQMQREGQHSAFQLLEEAIDDAERQVETTLDEGSVR